jgi:hypothetical protein
VLPLAAVGSANLRLIEAFATDEALQVNLLRGAAANHIFALTFGPYGHLVFNIILVVLRLLPGELTDTRIVLVGRTVSIVFAAATLWLTFVFARHVFGDHAAWIAFAALAVNATFQTWAVALKPDMTQLFFLMAALALTCELAEQPGFGVLALAAGAAGLAFAAKYSGLFVLPIIGAVSVWRPIGGGRVATRVTVLRWLTVAKAAALFVVSRISDAAWIGAHLTEDGRIDSIAPATLTRLSAAAAGAAVVALLAAATPWVWSALRKRQRLVNVLWSWTTAGAVFSITFVAVSPYSLRKAAFIKGLLGESAFVPEQDIAAWLSTWLGGIAAAVEWPVLVIAVATAAVLTWRAIRRVASAEPAELILIAWAVLYALVLGAPVHEFYVHYALPVIPPLAMLAGRGISAAADWLEARLARRGLAWALAAIAVIALIMFGSGDLLAARSRIISRERTSDAVLVGRWLECVIPGSDRIAYDYFSYVPPAFRDATPTWGGTREWLSRIDPDIIIVNRVTADAVRGEAAHAAYYACLADGSCGYGTLLERGALVVFGRERDVPELRARAGSVCDTLTRTDR